MLLCRRLSPIANRAHRIHYRTFFSQQILKQEEVTTPGDRSVPADQDTPDTHPAGTLEPKNTSYSASSTIATSYDKMRQNDPKVALHQISDPYFEKISYAAKNNDYHRIRTLVSKLILAKQEDEITRATMLRYTLLSVSLDKLPPNMVVSMLRMITKLLGPEYHSRKVINRIIPIILDLPPNAARQIVDLVYPSLLYNLQHIRHKKKTPPTTLPPSPFIVTSFTLLRWLLPRSQERSVELHKILVDMGHIPSSVLQGKNIMSGTLHNLYTSSIKACGERGWSELATELLNDYLKSDLEDSQKRGNDLALEVLGYLLDSPSENELDLCCGVIEKLHTTQPVPDEVIRDFYANAAQSNFSRPAKRLYLFSRDMRIDKYRPHNYPLPHGRSLVWLAEKFVSDDSTRPLFESLVEEAHERQQDILIPVSYQAVYLKLVTVEGFGLIANSLWEKWANGINGEVIRGSPEILVRMIRLSNSLTRKQKARLVSLKNYECPDSDKIGESGRILQAITLFAQKVIRAFIRQHEPIDEADHLILSTLARAHFVLGNISDGFLCFRMLLRRLEKPDIVDINIGLTALAEYEPRAAAAFLATMIHYNVEPDETTFSTIMHRAMIKDDLELCVELARQLKKTLEPKSHFQPFYSMVTASMVERSGDSPQRQITRLSTVLKVLRIMDYPVDRFDMYPEVGRSLIRACLPHYPKVAFEFWEIVCKGMARDDVKQVQLIRKALREAWSRGNIELIELNEMLSKLLRS